jgi:plastocyanin
MTVNSRYHARGSAVATRTRSAQVAQGVRRARVWHVVVGVALAAHLAPASPATALPQGAATGRVEGVATISSRLTTSRLRVRVYDEPGTPPAKPPADDHPFANVVFYLDAAPALRGAAPARHAAPALHQSGERFVPHVLPVVSGATVEFPNDDEIFHNVFSLSRAKTFDLGRFPQGTSRSVTFPSAGVVQVFCHIHADMNGYILVLDNPFFVVPDAQGRFALDGIPPGDYRLIAWHERIRPVVTPVHVDAGKSTAVQVRIPIPEAATPP